MRSKVILLVLIVTLTVVSISEANWIETFDTGVGRFQYTEENGDSVFAWNSTSQSLDATFIRRVPVDRRYALMPTVKDVCSGAYGFSTVINITGQTPGPVSDVASARFGFFNSSESEAQGAILVGAIITRPSEGQKYFYLKTAERTTETIRISQETIPFEYGNDYFIDTIINSSERLFQADFYRGTDKTGDYLGALSAELVQGAIIGFDSLGFIGDGDSQQTIVEANFDNFGYVPEPATLLLFGFGGLVLRKRK